MSYVIDGDPFTSRDMNALICALRSIGVVFRRLTIRYCDYCHQNQPLVGRHCAGCGVVMRGKMRGRKRSTIVELPPPIKLRWLRVFWWRFKYWWR